MQLYPNYYLKSVTDVTEELLEKNKIKGIILDVDNTLIDFDHNLKEGLEDWIKLLKAKKIKFCVLSNSNKKEKVKKVAETIDVPYLFFATKPLKRGFKKAKEILKLKSEQIAVVGDQIFTDILGANRCHMLSILVEPIAEKDILITVIKRPIEKYIIKKYKKKQKDKGE